LGGTTEERIFTVNGEVRLLAVEVKGLPYEVPADVRVSAAPIAGSPFEVPEDSRLMLVGEK
jgi:hypothetical protein